MNFFGVDFTKPISRVNVVGTSGSGKSTFARKLAQALGHPYIEMDKLFWRPNWVKASDEEFLAGLREAVAQERWVLDGNYHRTTPIKWERVEVVVWLDYSFTRTLLQITGRALARAWTQTELWQGTGNRESFRRSLLSKESIIWWMITTHRPMRERYRRVMQDPAYARVRFVRLRNHAEADRFLEACRRESSKRAT